MIGLDGQLIGWIINITISATFKLHRFAKKYDVDMHPALFRNLSSAMRPWDKKPWKFHSRANRM